MWNCDIYKLFIFICVVFDKLYKRISLEYMVCFLDVECFRVDVEGVVVVNSRIRGVRLYNKELKLWKVVF